MRNPFLWLTLGTLAVVAALIGASAALRLDTAGSESATRGHAEGPNVTAEPSLVLPAPSRIEAAPPISPAPDEDADALLRDENRALRAALAAASTQPAPLPMLLGDERPEEHVALTASHLLRPYPVVLSKHEALWICDRVAARDWIDYGETIDEVLIEYLRPDRIFREVPLKRAEQLAWEWPEYFSGMTR